MERPNGVDTQLQYSSRSEILSVNDGLSPVTYTYDDTGNRLSRTDSEGVSTFNYDSLSRLLGVEGPNPEVYEYDSLGNRTTSHLSTDYQTNTLNQLLEDDRYLYRYDANGNLTEREEKSTGRLLRFTYDAENQLIRIDFPDSTFVTYAYDALGRRIEKNVNSLLTRYVYDGEDILLEYDGTNTLRSFYTHGPGIDEPLSLARDQNLNSTFESTERFFYHQDGLGSITSLTDSSGTLVQSYTYDAFGNLLSQSGSLSQPYTFTAREFDPESGLFYYRRRYYDPRIGRFLSEDPLGGFVGSPESFNRYPYVSNNPLVSTDPFGSGDIAERIAEELTKQYGNVLTKEKIYETATAVERAKVIGFKEKLAFLTGDPRAKKETFRRVLEKLKEKAAHDPEGKRLLDEFADAIETIDPELAKLCRL